MSTIRNICKHINLYTFLYYALLPLKNSTSAMTKYHLAIIGLSQYYQRIHEVNILVSFLVYRNTSVIDFTFLICTLIPNILSIKYILLIEFLSLGKDNLTHNQRLFLVIFYTFSLSLLFMSLCRPPPPHLLVLRDYS